MGFRNLLSRRNVDIMKAAPSTDKTEVTFSAISKVRVSEGVIDMATVGRAGPPYVHTEAQALRSRTVKRCCGERDAFVFAHLASCGHMHRHGLL